MFVFFPSWIVFRGGGHSEKLSNMSARRNVKYVEQEEPSFLKKFKERVGYKEPADIKDKYAEDKPTAVEESEENEREKEDEQPVVVQLKSGDLSAEEAAKLKQESSNEGGKATDIIYLQAILTALLGKYKFFGATLKYLTFLFT